MKTWAIAALVWAAAIFSAYWYDISATFTFQSFAGLVPVDCAKATPSDPKLQNLCWVTIPEWRRIRRSEEPDDKFFRELLQEKLEARQTDAEIVSLAFRESGARKPRTADDLLRSVVFAAGLPPLTLLLLIIFFQWQERHAQLVSYELIMLRLWQLLTATWVMALLCLYLIFQEWDNLVRALPPIESDFNWVLNNIVFSLPLSFAAMVGSAPRLFFSALLPPLVLFSLGLGFVWAARAAHE